MRPTTIKRHQLIRQAFNSLLGSMPVMRIYTEIGERFGLSDETVRQILAKKPGASFRFRKERPPPRKVFMIFMQFLIQLVNFTNNLPEKAVLLHSKFQNDL